jgi:cytochrome c oxidase cbb3-type subunit 2
MENELKLILGSMVTLSLATSAMIVVPFLQLRHEPAPADLKPYTSQELRGREAYRAHACIACHSQQPSATGAGVLDASRGWGRASVAGDYFYDDPPLLGSMRTGPDLLNIGARQPSQDWHLGHLFQPRAYTPGSNMPAYRFLFEIKTPDQVAEGERVVHLPPGVAQEGKVVVATPEALDLVAYLISLNRTYPVLPTGRIAAPDRPAPPSRQKEPS